MGINFVWANIDFICQFSISLGHIHFTPNLTIIRFGCSLCVVLLILFCFFILFCLGGHTQRNSGLPSDSAFWNTSWGVLGDCLGFWWLNPHQMHARQAPHLFYHSALFYFLTLPTSCPAFCWFCKLWNLIASCQTFMLSFFSRWLVNSAQKNISGKTLKF